MKHQITLCRFLSSSASPQKFIPMENNKLWGTYSLENETWENKEIFAVKREDGKEFRIGDQDIYRFRILGETITADKSNGESVLIENL